jgi:dTDP-4-dehydrorhamnose reductase
MKILVIGATGMLGYSLFKNLREYPELEVYGTVRNLVGKESYFMDCQSSLIQGVDVTNLVSLHQAVMTAEPDVVINCVGLIKQHDIAAQHVAAIAINSLLPHQLADICNSQGCRLIHFSTDCVFDGKTGGYREDDLPTAMDLYGRSKALGEVNYAPHLTLRTSIIGHELTSTVSLVDWFLSQQDRVKGFSKAVFSGLPTCVIARFLAESILPNDGLTGMYHLSVDPVDKYSLLKLVSELYGKDIEIDKFEDFEIDRSLNSNRLINDAKLTIPIWPMLITEMHSDFEKRYKDFR